MTSQVIITDASKAVTVPDDYVHTTAVHNVILPCLLSHKGGLEYRYHILGDKTRQVRFAIQTFTTLEDGVWYIEDVLYVSSTNEKNLAGINGMGTLYVRTGKESEVHFEGFATCEYIWPYESGIRLHSYKRPLSQPVMCVFKLRVIALTFTYAPGLTKTWLHPHLVPMTKDPAIIHYKNEQTFFS